MTEAEQEDVLRILEGLLHDYFVEPTARAHILADLDEYMTVKRS